MNERRNLTSLEAEAAAILKKLWFAKKKELNLKSQERESLDMNWSGTVINQYLNGTIPLNTDAVLKISNRLKADPTPIISLLGKSKIPAPTFHDCTEGSRVTAVIRDRSSNYRIPHDSITTKEVPLISSVQAGGWREIIEFFQPDDAEEWISTTARVGAKAFALKVKGRSMEPKIPDGAIVIVDPDAQPENGKIVVARLEDSMEATIKRLVIDGPLKFLEPINQAYPPIPIDGNCTIVGVAKKVEIDL